jgi:hypothetical protein
MKRYFCQARIRRVVKADSWIQAKELFSQMVKIAYHCGELNDSVKLMTKVK